MLNTLTQVYAFTPDSNTTAISLDRFRAFVSPGSSREYPSLVKTYDAFGPKRWGLKKAGWVGPKTRPN